MDVPQWRYLPSGAHGWFGPGCGCRSTAVTWDVSLRGRSSAGRAPDWQSGGSWVRVPSPPPKSLMGHGVSRTRFRPDDPSPRHPRARRSFQSVSPGHWRKRPRRGPRLVHRVGDCAEVARIQVRVGAKEDRRIVTKRSRSRGHRHTALRHETRRRVARHGRASPRTVGRVRRRRAATPCGAGSTDAPGFCSVS
jgi:hypothetical protein